MHIRAGQGPDVVALRDIVERAYSSYIERIGRRPAPMDDDYAEKLRESHVFVADDGGEVVGLIVLLAKQDHLLIENVAVDSEHQGKGIGRSLMAYAEVYAHRTAHSRAQALHQCCDDRESRLLPPFGLSRGRPPN